MLKKLLLGLLVVVIVLVLAAVGLVMFVDVNRFKPQIESFVQSNYQRQLSFEGDLAWSFYPRLGVSLPAIKLSEHAGKEQAMSLQSAQVGVSLLPLFKGSLQADVVRIKGLSAKITRQADGSMSIDDLVGKSPPAAGEAPAPGAASPITDLRIGGIELIDASVQFDDRMAKNQYSVTGLTLKTGALADGQPTTIALNAQVGAAKPAAKLTVSLNGDLAVKVADAAASAKALTLQVKGSLDAMPLDLQLQLDGVSADPARIAIQALKLVSNVEQGARKLQVTLATPLTYDLAGGKLALPALDGQVGINDPAVGDKPLQLPFKGSAQVDVKAEQAAVKLSVDAPDTVLKADVSVKGFGSPAIRFALDADRIDVDKYLPPAAKQAAAAPAKPAAGAPAAEAPIDLSALNGLNVDGQVKVGQLKASGIEASNLSMSVKVANGRLDVAPLRADLYQGKVDARASILAKGNRVTLAGAVTNVAIAPLLQAVADTNLLEGTGNVNIDVQTGGATVTAMKKALAGKADMALRNGAIRGINLGEKIRQAKSLLSGGNTEEQADANQKTDFTALTASFDIRDGVATNKDLDGKSPLFRLSGEGSVDIAAGRLDYVARASVVGTAKGQGGKDVEELRGVTLPVRLSGPFETLGWKIEWAEAAKAALASQAADKLKEKLAPEREKLEAKVEERKEQLEERKQELLDKAAGKAADKLKGLFK